MPSETSLPSLQIPYSQQKKNVILISLGFFSIFTAFSPLQTVVTKLYINFGHQYFGPISISLIYLTFAFSTSLASMVIQAYGFKKTLMFSAMAYTFFQSSGLIIYYFGDIRVIAWFAVTVPAVLCGFFAACIWVAQSGYIGNISQLEYREEMFGIFVAFRGAATLVGYFMNLYLLTKFSEPTFFKVLIPIGALSIFVFSCLQYTKEIQARYSHQMLDFGKLKQKIHSYFMIFKDRHNLPIYLYSLTPGILTAIGAILLYQIGLSTVSPRLQTEPLEEYKKRENQDMTQYLFFFGFFQVFMGFFMKNISKKLDCYQIAFYGSCCLCILSALTTAGYCLQIFSLNCLLVCIWGITTTIHRANCFTLYSKHFKNDLNMFGVFNFFNALGCAVFIIIITFASKQSIILCLIVLIVTFAVISHYGFELHQMKRPIEQDRSLQMNLITKQ